MQFITFQSNNLRHLQQQVDEWLRQVHVSDVKFQFSVLITPNNQIQYTLAAFYITLQPVA